jgi:hypothetical protein
MLTARMPVDALTANWSLGQNRRIDKYEVRKLHERFSREGLNRNAKENRLLVLCDRIEVLRMIRHLGLDKTSGHGSINRLPFFKDWLSVNNGSLVEIMAGQHRIKALESYAEAMNAGKNVLWWTCELYDRSELQRAHGSYWTIQVSIKFPTKGLIQNPGITFFHLNTKLRVNPLDLDDADIHGQIWQRAAVASSQNPGRFEQKPACMESVMRDTLQLGSDVRVPLRRLVAIWRDERWRDMTTQWCDTIVGRALFRIPTWDWMMSCRVDDVS